jgi:hypothetical protein
MAAPPTREIAITVTPTFATIFALQLLERAHVVTSTILIKGILLKRASALHVCSVAAMYTSHTARFFLSLSNSFA